MSLLEVITRASANGEPAPSQSEYPIILNAHDVFRNMKPKLDDPDDTLLACPVTGWQLSEMDTQLIDLGKKFFTKLKRKLKDTHKFSKDEFSGVLNPFLERVGKIVGIPTEVGSGSGHTLVLIGKVGFLMGRDVVGLILEACLRLEIWDLVEALIVYGTVDHSQYSNLLVALAAKRRSDLVCLCVKHAKDLGLSDLLCVLKYFLCPSKDAYGSMVNVREEWENQALLAVEMVKDENVSNKNLVKDASVLLMVAYDGFSTSELCLHYLLSSPNIDEVTLATSIGKLNVKEMMSLIRYLGKWIKKYHKFPQVVPCPEASSIPGLNICAWVPTLADIVRWLGLVLDENFSSLVLHPEFHKELKSIQEAVVSLASEARLCCSLSNVFENL